jgi:uncharacterized membrane protein HdeD (DUF308 family)
VRAVQHHEGWWPTLLAGLPGIGAGALIFAWPAITALSLVYLIRA